MATPQRSSTWRSCGRSRKNEEQPEDRGTFPFWLETHVDDGRVEEPENRIYEVTVLVNTRQYVQFSAPEGMDSEEAKAWFDEHRDDEGAIVFEGSEEVADEELYVNDRNDEHCGLSLSGSASERL